MSKYKVKYHNRISVSDYTLNQAKERVEFLNETFKGCNAHMVKIREKEKMKKNELKSGMIVEYRDGEKRLVIDNDLIGDDGHSSLSNFNDDLKHILYSDLDIIKVYKYKYTYIFSELLKDDNLNLIWERKEIKLTDKEIEILKALKVLGYEFLSRDGVDYDSLYAYSEKPYKAGDYWIIDAGDYLKINSDFLDFIKWEDKEPKNIDDLLKGV